MIHIANTHVEFEYASSVQETLQRGIARYPTSLQLQFLPLLYAESNDIVGVTAIPPEEYLTSLRKTFSLPKLALLDDLTPFQGAECVSWGASQQIQKWAQERNVKYQIPDWEVVKKINSKAFSFQYTSLTEAALISDEEHLHRWLKKISGKKVLKTCFGLAGQGNFIIDNQEISPSILSQCRKEWKKGCPIIAEPWLDRREDFSTQWRVFPDQRIELVGGTRFIANAKGVYEGTVAGPKEMLFSSIQPFFEEHCNFVLKALKDVASLGFFGSLGIDAFLYFDPITQQIQLNPLVEINGRETMSLVALRLQERLCPNRLLRLDFQLSNDLPFSLLPRELEDKHGQKIKFARKLYLS